MRSQDGQVPDDRLGQPAGHVGQATVASRPCGIVADLSGECHGRGGHGVLRAAMVFFAYVAKADIYCRSFASRPGFLDDAARGGGRSEAAGDLVEERHARGDHDLLQLDRTSTRSYSQVDHQAPDGRRASCKLCLNTCERADRLHV